MRLENERFCVEIAELGAELTRVYDKKAELDILWEGDPAFWKRHSPVLFPNVGKTYKNTVLINGTHYPTSQHGFARDNMFRCISSAKDSASFLFASTEETKEVYPFDFELVITYTLMEDRIQVQWEVKNPSDETIYFTIGGHPAFRFAQAGEKKSDYLLWFPGMGEAECILLVLPQAAADPTRTYELSLEQGYAPVSEEMFENDALIFDGGQIREVWLCRKDRTPYVGLKCPGFPSFGIWSVKDAPFVCLEPWMGRCDDVGFASELSEKPGVNKVEPGGKFRQSYEILVRK